MSIYHKLRNIDKIVFQFSPVYHGTREDKIMDFFDQHVKLFYFETK
jgi:hypothetical protein